MFVSRDSESLLDAYYALIKYADKHGGITSVLRKYFGVLRAYLEGSTFCKFIECMVFIEEAKQSQYITQLKKIREWLVIFVYLEVKLPAESTKVGNVLYLSQMIQSLQCLNSAYPKSKKFSIKGVNILKKNTELEAGKILYASYKKILAELENTTSTQKTSLIKNTYPCYGTFN